MARRRPMSQEAKDRLAMLRKVRRTLTQLGEEPTPYSGWSKNIGFSTPFPDEEPTYGETYSPTYEDDYSYAEDSDGPVDGPPPEDTGGPSLPPPSEIYELGQSKKSDKPTPRPDLHPEFYGDGSSRSTRVQAMQWIPTTVVDSGPAIDPDSDEYQKAMLYGYDATNNASLYGDILVAFARPSKNQEPQALYVFKGNPESNWNMLRSSDSVGRAIRLLQGGLPYLDSDGERYKDLHKATIDPETDSPWALWIFDQVWSLRANNATATYTKEEARKAAVAAPIKYRFD